MPETIEITQGARVGRCVKKIVVFLVLGAVMGGMLVAGLCRRPKRRPAE